jgi:hypothetical protein
MVAEAAGRLLLCNRRFYTKTPVNESNSDVSTSVILPDNMTNSRAE